MSILISIFVAVIIFALLWYLINILPVDGRFKQVLQIILILMAIIYLLGGVGVFGGWAWHR